MALEVNEEQRKRRRCDSGHAPRLAERGRPHLTQALPHFCGKPAHVRVVEVVRQAQLFVPALPLDFDLLPVDVAGVLREHVDLQCDLLDQPLVRVWSAHPFRGADRGERGE